MAENTRTPETARDPETTRTAGIPSYELNDGSRLPAIGFGTYPLRGDDGVQAIDTALDLGYRLLDTAVNYRNEDSVGRAVASSSVPRGEVLVQTKIPGRDHGHDEALASFETSRRALGVEVIDLYLIHWPNPSVDKFVDTWKAMIELRDAGSVRSIGVSNFTPQFLDRLEQETGVLPAVNQVELHPYFPQTELLAYHAEAGVRTEAWSPLGKNSSVLEQKPILDAAATHGVTSAQVVLRWHVQLGSVALPKSKTPARIGANRDVFDFALTDDEQAAITALGRPDGRLFDGDPNTHEEM